jgi:hypothetical protein
VASREVEVDFGRLDERLLGLSGRVDDLRDELRSGLTDVRGEVRSLRLRIDTLLLTTIAGLLGVIATLAVKL